MRWWTLALVVACADDPKGPVAPDAQIEDPTIRAKLAAMEGRLVSQGETIKALRDEVDDLMDRVEWLEGQATPPGASGFHPVQQRGRVLDTVVLNDPRCSDDGYLVLPLGWSGDGPPPLVWQVDAGGGPYHVNTKILQTWARPGARTDGRYGVLVPCPEADPEDSGTAIYRLVAN